MRARSIAVMGMMLALTGCGTPQEQCINGATRDLRVVDGLIAEVQGNLDRGYAMVEVSETRPEFIDCTPRPTKAEPNPVRRQCFEDVTRTTTRPAAINLDDEAAKLASLQRKRDQLARAAAPAITICRQQYPE